MILNWGEERYVRAWLRDTPAWCALTFFAQGLYVLVSRKVDRDGRLPLGTPGLKGVAGVLHQVAIWESVIKPALEELLAGGFLVIEGKGAAMALVIPRFREAQEAVSSGAARNRAYRARKKAGQTGDETSREGDATSRPETKGDPSQPAVPPLPAVPSDPAGHASRDPNRPTADGGQAGQDNGSGTGDDVERLRADLSAFLGRTVGGCKGKKREALRGEIARLGYAVALQAAQESAEELERKRDPLRSVAALPGWLATVDP